jgi:hypothetical protein
MAPTGEVMINTVKVNEANYGKRELDRARLARKVPAMIGCPSTWQYIYLAKKKLLPNCPVTRRDIVNSECIVVPNVGIPKETTVDSSPFKTNPKVSVTLIAIMKRYSKLIVAVDIMYVNTIPFLITALRGIKFGTSEALPSRKVKDIINALINLKVTYFQQGFSIEYLLMDGKFEACHAGLSSIQIGFNITSTAEHVPDVERYNRTVEENNSTNGNVIDNAASLAGVAPDEINDTESETKNENDNSEDSSNQLEDDNGELNERNDTEPFRYSR